MKLRTIVANDRPETIEAQKTLLLEANPDYVIDGININPIEKNDQREGTFEVDFHLKHADEELFEKRVADATLQLQSQKEQAEDLLKEERKKLKDRDAEIKELKKK